MLTTDVLLIVIGIFSGFLSGLFGLGGGITVIPCLLITLSYFGVVNDVLMHVALGTSLSIMMANSIITACHHHRGAKVNTDILKQFFPYIAIGAVLGSVIASHLGTNLLMGLFIIFLMVVIFSKLRQKKGTSPIHISFNEKPTTVGWYGILTGMISTSVGGGSSLMMVPFLTKRNFKVQQAVAISSVFNIFLAGLGTVSYILFGWHQSTLKYSLGYVYLPAAVLIIAGGFVGVPMGVGVLKRINDNVAKILYFLLIIGILIMMILKLISSVNL